MTRRLEIVAPAKLNLHLQVVARRSDGYHELRTLFQSISIADRLSVELAAPGIRLEVTGARVGAGPENLAWRAAAKALERWGDGSDGLAIRLEKRIPIGGGLGGGSADAAAVLCAGARLLGAEPTYSELHDIARGLGADVPYFLLGGTAFGFGRGDELVALPDEPPVAPVVALAIAPVEVSTARVFAALGEPMPRPLPGPLISRLCGVGGSMAVDYAGWAWNDLEAVALALSPEIRSVYDSLARAEARFVRLSGSGATLFAGFDDREAAERARSFLPQGTVWSTVEMLARAEWRARVGCAPEV